MKSRATASVALVAILALAAVLRFTALGWGLRHEPDWDERVFVQSAAWMVASGDFDHRFYEYPGFFVYMLGPVVAPHGPPEVGPSAYLAARRLVAAFGVASVLLVFFLGRRLNGQTTGLAAALLLAVSPLDIQTAHMVRPDVVLASFFLIALLVFDAAIARRHGDWWCGLAIGAAAAVKFSGALIVPSYLIRRWTSPGSWWRGPLQAGLAALATFVVLSPFSFINWGRFMEGAGVQWSYHYDTRESVRSFGGNIWNDLHRLEHSFGPVAALLIAAGLVLALKDGRRWWPALALPVVVMATMATADVQWPRFLVPITGVLALLAGRLIAAVSARVGAPGGIALALAAAAMPAMSASRYVRDLRAPSARDRALDWIAANASEGARLLSTVKDLGLDRTRFEVLVAEQLDARTQRWAAHMDLVVSGPQDDPSALAGFDVVQAFEPAPVPSDVAIRVLRPGAAIRPVYVALPIDAASLAVSENPEQAAAMVDGDVETFWRTNGPQVPDASWIEVRLPQRATIGRVVVGLGRHWRREPRNLHVFARDGDAPWRRLPAFPGRAPVDQQPLPVAERSLELIVPPTPITAVRLVQVGRAGKHWNVAALRLEAVP
jgi:hypothetical protein